MTAKIKIALLGLAALAVALFVWQGPFRAITYVDAADYDAYWLWAGVKPQPVLEQAKAIYILDSEIKAAAPANLVGLRPAIPRLPDQKVWMVVRVETLNWPEGLDDHIIERMAGWKAADNNLVGLQIDFDAGTKGLAGYASFLKKLRAKLPPELKLSITGLLDWSANGDPIELNALGRVVDEVVLQTYQGKRTIAGYQTYLAKLDRLKMPFRIGLVQGGEWREPESLPRHPQFKGYVVFLVNSD